ncbi:MAG: hypothetical protein ACFWUL_04015 [Dialister sp.]
MVKFKNRVINWQIRCNRQWQKALPWGTMITGIFAFHHNTIIPLKKVSGSLESDTFFGDCFNSIISQPRDHEVVEGWPPQAAASALTKSQPCRRQSLGQRPQPGEAPFTIPHHPYRYHRLPAASSRNTGRVQIGLLFLHFWIRRYRPASGHPRSWGRWYPFPYRRTR